MKSLKEKRIRKPFFDKYYWVYKEEDLKKTLKELIEDINESELCRHRANRFIAMIDKHFGEIN
jgi:hypothetical protein